MLSVQVRHKGGRRRKPHTHTLTTIPGSRSEGCELRTSVFRSTRLCGDNSPRYDLEAPSLSDHINRSIALHSDLSQTSARTHSKTNRPLSVNADRQTGRQREEEEWTQERNATQRLLSVYTAWWCPRPLLLPQTIPRFMRGAECESPCFPGNCMVTAHVAFCPCDAREPPLEASHASRLNTRANQEEAGRLLDAAKEDPEEGEPHITPFVVY